MGVMAMPYDYTSATGLVEDFCVAVSSDPRQQQQSQSSDVGDDSWICAECE